MVTTNAHIGNYGTSLDLESKSVKISALVCAKLSGDLGLMQQTHY
jgi:carbamoylphosphate synthase small subunit